MKHNVHSTQAHEKIPYNTLHLSAYQWLSHIYVKGSNETVSSSGLVVQYWTNNRKVSMFTQVRCKQCNLSKMITVGATPSTGRHRRGGCAFDGQRVAWASGCGGRSVVRYATRHVR